MDRISDLPKTILHDILSRLLEKDAVRTSVLSKAWRETWSTFPVVSICDTRIMRRSLPMEDKRKIFVDFVKKTFLRFSEKGLAIKEFMLDLSTNFYDLEYMSADIDLCMKFASESGVEVLKLWLPSGLEYQCYSLTPVVLENKSLNKLSLRGGMRVDEAFLKCSIKFFSLRELFLRYVLLGDEGAFENLISHCPMIEHINMDGCYVYNHPRIGDLPASRSRTSLLKSVNLHGLQKLKEVTIGGILEVSIDAPNLESLCYCLVNRDLPFKLNYDNCRNLRWLHLWSLKCTVLENQWFLELFSKFPLLESLKLGHCSFSEMINISSAQLKFLELSYCSDLKEVNIDAPNLLSCRYDGHGSEKPVISFLRSSTHLEVNVRIGMSSLDPYSLRETIQNFKPEKVLTSLSLNIYESFVVKPNQDVSQVSSPPPSIKNLHLIAVPEKETCYLPLVNLLLSSCRPETISLSLYSWRSCSKAFVELLYETLTGRGQGDCHCSSGPTKCWWHGLKDVKVISSFKAGDNNIDFKTMLDAWPTSAILRLALL